MRRVLWMLAFTGLLVFLANPRSLEGPAPPVASPAGDARAPASVAPAPTSIPTPTSTQTPTPAPAVSARLAALPWSSREACFAALAAPRPAKGRFARLAAWNLEWFPDGSPGKRAAKPGKDLEWLACAIALLEVDVLALSEVKALPRARAALDSVLRRVEALRGGSYRSAIDPCPPESGQHVAVVWNAARVRNDALQLYGELNPHGSPCEGQLRPGFGGYFRFPGGLDLEIVSVHLKSGTEERDLNLRRRSWRALAEVSKRAESARRDDDLIVIGDFNAMGCDDCRVKADAERRELSLLDPAFALLDVSPGCSHYHRRRGGLLDLALVRRGMRELPAAAKVSAVGYCAETRCRALGDDEPAARSALSDHCPIVLDLVDRDLD